MFEIIMGVSLVGLFIVSALLKRERKEVCKGCREKIPKKATVCVHCQTRKEVNNRLGCFTVLFILCAICGIILVGYCVTYWINKPDDDTGIESSVEEMRQEVRDEYDEVLNQDVSPIE